MSLTAAYVEEHGLPHPGLPAEVNEWREENGPAIRRALETVGAVTDRAKGLPPRLLALTGTLHLAALIPQADGTDRRVELGLASCELVVTSGLTYLVDCLQNLQEPEKIRYHGIGIGDGVGGATTPAPGDAGLQSEVTTNLQTPSTRVQGTLSEKSGTPTAFETVATVRITTGLVKVTEHGVFYVQPTTTTGLFDRATFAVYSLPNGGGLVVTYDLQLVGT